MAEKAIKPWIIPNSRVRVTRVIIIDSAPNRLSRRFRYLINTALRAAKCFFTLVGWLWLSHFFCGGLLEDSSRVKAGVKCGIYVFDAKKFIFVLGEILPHGMRRNI